MEVTPDVCTFGLPTSHVALSPRFLTTRRAVRLELQDGTPVLRASTVVQRRITTLSRKQKHRTLSPSKTAMLDQTVYRRGATLLQPDAILAVCSEIGDTSWRDRVLTPVTTAPLLLLQMLHGNTACSHLPPLTGLRFSAAAYGQARARLPLRFFDLLSARFGSAVPPCLASEGRWPGQRTCSVDAPDAPCPIPLLTVRLRPADGAATWVRLSRGATAGAVPRRHGTAPEARGRALLPHDHAQVQAVHPTRQAADVLVAERGLCSYAHFALRVQPDRHAVLRIGARQSVDFTPGRPVVTPGDRLPEPQGRRCVRIPSH